MSYSSFPNSGGDRKVQTNSDLTFNTVKSESVGGQVTPSTSGTFNTVHSTTESPKAVVSSVGGVVGTTNTFIVSAVEPTVRDNNEALQTGDIWWNTTDGISYFYVNGAWEADANPTVTLDDVAGVTITTVEEGNFLRYDGSEWVNSDIQISDIPDLSGSYASSVQGSLADSAVQPGDNISTLTNDAGYITLEDIPEVTNSVTSVNSQTGVVVLDADDIDDTNTAHKFVTESQIAKLIGIQTGAEVNVNADWNAVSGDALILNKPILGTAAATDSTDYATATQGALADSAVQPGDNVSDLTNDTGYITLAEVPADAVSSVNTQTGAVVLDADDIDDSSTTNKFTTSADIAKLAGIEAGAEVNVNADWNAVSGDALILNKPTLGTAAAADTTDFATAGQGSLADSAVQPGDNISTLTNDSSYITSAGAPVQSVNTQTGAVVLDADDIDDSSTTNKFTTSADITKLAGIETGAEVNTVTSVASKTGDVALVKADVGLSDVDNTSDINKPISTATQSALNLKADLVGGVVPNSQLPSLAITEYLGTVANEAALLALSGERGDWAIRTDTGSTWVITTDGGSLITDWTELATPADSVSSVNGFTGAVVLGPSDVGAATATQGATADSALQPGDNISDLANDAGYITSADIPDDAVVSVNGQSGIVVLDADDIDDTNTTHKFTTSADITKLAGIEPNATTDQTGPEIKALYEAEPNTNAFTDSEKTKLSTVATGAEVNVNADWNAVSGDALILNKPTLGTAAATDSTDYATATQGSTADSALQPGDNISDLANDTGYITSSGAPVQSVNTQTGAVVLDADDIDDTSTINKFVTQANLNDIGTALQPGDNVSDLNNNIGYITLVDIPAISLDDLTDVDTTTVAPLDGQALVWSSIGSEWIPGEVAGSTEVTSMPPTNPDVGELWYDLDSARLFVWIGSAWVDAAPGITGEAMWDRTGTTITSSEPGDNLYISGNITVDGTVDGRDVAADGLVLDTALQPGDNVSDLTNDANYIDAAGAPVQSVAGKTGAVSLVKADITDFSDADYATATQGALADTAVQRAGDTMTGALGMPVGSATSPSVHFDANSGLYSPGADQVAISTNGAGRLFVASDGKIGIGAFASTRLFEVNSGSFATKFSGNQIEFTRDSVNYIQANGGNSSSLAFTTGGNTERLRITSDGKLGLGTTSPGSLLTLDGASSTSLGRASTYIHVGGEDFGVGSYRLVGLGYAPPASEPPAFIGYVETNPSSNTNGALIFGTRDVITDTAPTERARLDSSGNFLLGGTLPASPNINLDASGTGTFAGGNIVLGSLSSGGYVSANRTIGNTAAFQASLNGTATAVIRAEGSAYFPSAVGVGSNQSTPEIALNANGSASFAGKVTSASTESGDAGETLATKDYVDANAGSGFGKVLAWGRVENDGGVIAGSGNWSGSSPATGTVTVVFNPPLGPNATVVANAVDSVGMYTVMYNGSDTVDFTFYQGGGQGVGDISWNFVVIGA